jgi:myo-inositol-1(or 4)-monophosphatase
MAHKSPLINVMDAAARKASRRLLRDFGEVEQLQVSEKGPSDFVSSADLKAEQTIREELEKARPDYSFLMEEGGKVEGKDKSNCWIIDPLDGTMNFLHGVPHFCISIALERDSEIFAGVIYDPTRDEMFYAEKGQGAFVNDKRLRVSGRNQLKDSFVATGIPNRGRGNAQVKARFSREMTLLMPEVAGIRRMGSAALDFAWLAAGRYEAYWERGLSAWDIAAGLIILREAGGIVTEINLGERMLETGSVLAANGRMHDLVANILRKAAKS